LSDAALALRSAAESAVAKAGGTAATGPSSPDTDSAVANAGGTAAAEPVINATTERAAYQRFLNRMTTKKAQACTVQEWTSGHTSGHIDVHTLSGLRALRHTWHVKTPRMQP
jgi:hypothetical protein